MRIQTALIITVVVYLFVCLFIVLLIRALIITTPLSAPGNGRGCGRGTAGLGVRASLHQPPMPNQERGSAEVPQHLCLVKSFRHVLMGFM